MIKNFIEGDKIYLQELTNRINNPNYFKLGTCYEVGKAPIINEVYKD